jgi:hypothetical protein
MPVSNHKLNRAWWPVKFALGCMVQRVVTTAVPDSSWLDTDPCVTALHQHPCKAYCVSDSGPHCTTLGSGCGVMPQVGTISANGDTEIGQLIARAMERVGKEGVITVSVGPMCTSLMRGSS